MVFVNAGAFNALPGGGLTSPARITPADVTWIVCEEDGLWHAIVTQVRIRGTIRVSPWPAAGTPRPVAGGNVTAANWRAIVADLENYDTVGVGGAGPVWHHTQATNIHER
ncbi:MAG: hypothetical protein L0170_06020, partial [Acidobacteria bacterium]|nr:hypothetical protein [Acidobacteriota bacterium]